MDVIFIEIAFLMIQMFKDTILQARIYLLLQNMQKLLQVWRLMFSRKEYMQIEEKLVVH
jgi:hypothetical protein